MPSLPPLSWFRVSLRPGFFSLFQGFVHFTSTGDGCRSGGLGLVLGLLVGKPVGVLPPWGVIAVAAPWPMGTQPPLATRALIKLFDMKKSLEK